MAYDARAVANYLLEAAKKERKSIDPMGIQKLVYFAHGWHLAILGHPLITQRIEAWTYGPVIRDLYVAFKRFGNSPITEPAQIWDIEPGTMRIQIQCPQLSESQDGPAIALLDRIWEVYKGFTSIQLSNMTHASGSPWSQARDQDQTVIDDGAIKTYFTSQMNAN